MLTASFVGVIHILHVMLAVHVLLVLYTFCV